MRKRSPGWVLSVLVGLCALVLALSLSPGARAKGPTNQRALDRIIQVQERHTKALMAREGVVGTAVGLSQDDEYVVKVYVKNARDRAGLPKELDGVPVVVEVSGEIRALVDPTARFDRPVPTGVSTGHPDITAGTIACRVTDGTDVFALSNNHVYANENLASIGDNVLQPGTFDGGTNPADAIGTLADFEPLTFDGSNNVIDAAIALSSTANLGTATPEDGYGTPSSTTAVATVRMKVKKYGRTTGLTNGHVDAINATVDVGYDSGTARFVNQIVIAPGKFSAGGDSGSLIVTRDGNQPVGLLFAGSFFVTIANPIDPVLSRFGVEIDATHVNQPPTATDDSAATAQDTPVTIAVLANDTDPDADPLTVTNLTQPSSGAAVLNADQTVTYTPDPGFSGADSFTYTANDGQVDGNVATVSVTVGSVGAVTVLSIAPNTMQAGTRIGVTITGSGFVGGAKVTFEGGGGHAPKASKVKVLDANSITANVSARRVGAGTVWDVRVTNADSSTGVLADGFTVTP